MIVFAKTVQSKSGTGPRVATAAAPDPDPTPQSPQQNCAPPACAGAATGIDQAHKAMPGARKSLIQGSPKGN